MMERLPDELWLLVFLYLHKLDILYGFDQLNIRFQQIIEPYSYEIDLSNVSYKLFTHFVRSILPIHAPNIRSITLKNRFQLKLFQESLGNLINLQSLRLIGDHRSYTSEFDFYLEEKLKNCPHLNDLHVFGCFYMPNICLKIILNAPLTLTNLTVLCVGDTIPSVYDYIDNRQSMRMSNLKTLTVHVNDVKDIFSILRIMTNLEELNLSILGFDTLKYIYKPQVPTFLTKLHLDYGRFNRLNEERTKPSSFDAVKKFLDIFKYQLQSLILTITTDEKKFSDFDELQAVRNSFSRLTTFQYLIYTTNHPSSANFHNVQKLPGNMYVIHTNPRLLLSFGNTLRNNFTRVTDYDMSLEELYNATSLSFRDTVKLSNSKVFSSITFELPKLRKIFYMLKDVPEFSETKLLPRLLTLAPNLNFLYFNNENSHQIIELLKQIDIYQLRKISHLWYEPPPTTRVHRSFIADLAQLIPDLKCLWFSQMNFTTEEDSENHLMPKIAIDHAQNYFKNLINLQLNGKIIRGGHENQKFECFKVWLNDQDKNLFYYTMNETISGDIGLNIWL